MAGLVSFHARHDCGGNVSWHIPDMGRERRPPGITAQSLIIGGHIDADPRTRGRGQTLREQSERPPEREGSQFRLICVMRQNDR